ncbi:MAG: metal-dependent transcriptional regulator [Cyclobacteriaceae bacterium]
METSLSFTEENYLKAIYHLSDQDSKGVSTNSLAESVQTKPATVSDMIKKLDKKRLISYVKYQGVNLTPQGENIALSIIRKHRIWEVFLVEKLAFNWDEVHPIAEQLEHIQSDSLINKLDDFLNNPKVDPHGDPIPDRDGNFNLRPSILLAELELSINAIVCKVNSDDPRLLQYLDKVSIRPGTILEIIERNDFDNSLQIKVEKNRTLYLSNEIATQLNVTTIV